MPYHPCGDLWCGHLGPTSPRRPLALIERGRGQHQAGRGGPKKRQRAVGAKACSARCLHHEQATIIGGKRFGNGASEPWAQEFENSVPSVADRRFPSPTTPFEVIDRSKGPRFLDGANLVFKNGHALGVKFSANLVPWDEIVKGAIIFPRCNLEFIRQLLRKSRFSRMRSSLLMSDCAPYVCDREID